MCEGWSGLEGRRGAGPLTAGVGWEVLTLGTKKSAEGLSGAWAGERGGIGQEGLPSAWGRVSPKTSPYPGSTASRGPQLAQPNHLPGGSGAEGAASCPAGGRARAGTGAEEGAGEEERGRARGGGAASGVCLARC